MKHVYTFSFCLLAAVALAQSTATPKAHRFSFSLESGLVTSYMEMPESDFICCFGDCYTYGTDPTLRLRPMRLTSVQLGASANFELGRKHRIGLGVTRLEMGEMEPYGENLARRSMRVMGLTARHQFKVLSGSLLNFYVSNAVSLEKPKAESYLNVRNGVSHTLGLTAGIQITRLMEASLSIIGRTTIRGYHENAFYGDKHRFGGGLVFGLTHRI
ncbi:MAG: hypothetical protein IPN76_33005 [Saprospiraceae bacterium]|nr:hypothetical protein [Saprospiraceae bacterium]